MNKKIINIISILSVISALFLASCAKEDFDKASVKKYIVVIDGDTITDSNISIAELKAKYSGNFYIIDTNYIIKGTIISEDTHKNFYKKIVIQDSTAGIEIQIDDSNLSDEYQEGRLVYVRLKDAAIQNYNGVKQIAFMSNGSPVRIPSSALKKVVYKADGGKPIVPKIKKISELNASDISTLIKIENVEFVSGDTSRTWADLGADASRTIEDFANSQIVTRTSSYALFAGTKLPKGNGSIIAVYNVYGTTKQLAVRNLDEVDMNGERKQKLFEFVFSANIGEFIVKNVLGSKTWMWGTGGGKKYVYMSGYQNGANEDWLISPSIDLSQRTVAILSFSHAWNFKTNLSDITLWICDDYDGTSNPNESGNWTQLTDYNNPAGTNWTFVNSGPINISNFTGKSNVRFAYKYLCPANAASTWEIESVQITGK